MASATEELDVQSPGGASIAGDNKKREASPEPDVGDAAAQEAARKKKKTGPGSRGVANLTPEQLAKKRENDREAQRAIRKRTKEQIETLERRIQELTSQQPYQELLAVQRAKEAVEQENIEIKRRLATIIGELQPLLGNISDPSRLYASPSQTYAPSVPNVAPPPAPMSVHNASTPGSVPSPSSTDIGSQSWQSAGYQGEQARIQLNQQRHEMRHGLDMGPERLGLNFLLENNQRVARIHNGSDSAQDTPRYHHVPMRHDWTDNRNDQALRVRPGSGGGRWEASPRTPSTTGPTSRPSQMARDAPSPHYILRTQLPGLLSGPCPSRTVHQLAHWTTCCWTSSTSAASVLLKACQCRKWLALATLPSLRSSTRPIVPSAILCQRCLRIYYQHFRTSLPCRNALLFFTSCSSSCGGRFLPRRQTGSVSPSGSALRMVN
ncbi:hypothetical protein V2G26_001255 [Clonostachys chloroleuca]